MSGPHATFIAAAYAITFAVVGAAVISIVLRHLRLKRALEQLGEGEDRGS